MDTVEKSKIQFDLMSKVENFKLLGSYYMSFQFLTLDVPSSPYSLKTH